MKTISALSVTIFILLSSSNLHAQDLPNEPLGITFHEPIITPVELVVSGRLLKTDAKPVKVEYYLVYNEPPGSPTPAKTQTPAMGMTQIMQTKVADEISGAKDRLSTFAKSAVSEKFGVESIDLGVKSDDDVAWLEANGFKFKKGEKVTVQGKSVPVRLFAKEIYAPQDDYGVVSWKMRITCEKPSVDELGQIRLNASVTFLSPEPKTDKVSSGANLSVIKIKVGAFKTAVEHAKNDLLSLINNRTWPLTTSDQLKIASGKPAHLKPIPLPLENNLNGKYWSDGETIPDSLKSDDLQWSGPLNMPIELTGEMPDTGEQQWKKPDEDKN